MIFCELCQVFVDIYDDGNGNNQNDGIKIGANEFLDDIPIKYLDIVARIEETQLFRRGLRLFHI